MEQLVFNFKMQFQIFKINLEIYKNWKKYYYFFIIF